MNLKLLKETCRLSQTQLLEILPLFLKKYYKNVITTSDYIIAEGELPVALVAHLDTVGLLPPEDIYYDPQETIMWSPQLLGADDRAGVIAIINIIEDGYRPHIIFTCDEEKGCLGSFALCDSFPKRGPFKNLKAIIQLDRCNRNDSVFYDCNNVDFENFINKYGFKTAIGSFSDISVIAPSWGIAAVNLSIGYRNEHSIGETLNTTWMEESIEKVKKIISDIDSYKKFIYVPKVNGNNIFMNHKKYCAICQCKLTNKSRILTSDSIYVCKHCFNLYYNNN